MTSSFFVYRLWQIQDSLTCGIECQTVFSNMNGNYRILKHLQTKGRAKTTKKNYSEVKEGEKRWLAQHLP